MTAKRDNLSVGEGADLSSHPLDPLEDVNTSVLSRSCRAGGRGGGDDGADRVPQEPEAGDARQRYRLSADHQDWRLGECACVCVRIVRLSIFVFACVYLVGRTHEAWFLQRNIWRSVCPDCLGIWGQRHVSLRNCFSHIQDVKKKELSVFAEVHVSWTDDRLKWKPVNHGGVSTHKIDITKIWYPEIVLKSG